MGPLGRYIRGSPGPVGGGPRAAAGYTRRRSANTDGPCHGRHCLALRLRQREPHLLTRPRDGATPPSACAPLDLRSPTGGRILLTGRWRSPDGGTYYLRQAGSCLWFTGLSGDTGSPGGEGTADWTNSFFGRLASDFTVRGSWADLPWGDDSGVGEITWRIAIAEVAGQEGITLQVIDVSGGFGGEFLVRPETRVDLRVRLRDTGGCPALEDDDGEEYELVLLAPGWDLAVPVSLFGPNDERIFPSDSFQVSGEVARGIGDCGLPGLIIFADHIEASAP